MTSDEIKNCLSLLVQEELRLANEQNPAFNSPHEGYAVLKEEIEELGEETNAINDHLMRLWEVIKQNEDSFGQVKEIKLSANRAAYEAIQVAAMALKYIDSLY